MRRPSTSTGTVTQLTPRQQLPIKCFLLIFLFAVAFVSVYAVSQPFIFHPQLTPIMNISKSNDPLSLTKFYPHIATIVESRPVDHLVAVVHNVKYHIPTAWPIQIFHGKDNEQFIRNSTLAPFIDSGKIILTFMNSTYGRQDTASLLTDPKFWQRVRGEKVLFFQSDSIMCSNSPHRVTDYLQYDYVGAPWDLWFFEYDIKYRVGNGGFSLRTRSKILALLALITPDPKMPEDVFYAQNMRHVNGSIPSVEVAKTFAVESMYYERPVGVHRFPWYCPFRANLSKTCPEAMLIMYDVCPKSQTSG